MLVTMHALLTAAEAAVFSTLLYFTAWPVVSTYWKTTDGS